MTDGPGWAPAPPWTPPPCFRLWRYRRRIFRQKSSNDQKIARMARILTIFGPFEPHRRQLQFPKISNERKIIESIDGRRALPSCDPSGQATPGSKDALICDIEK